MAARDKLFEDIEVNMQLKGDRYKAENESMIAALYGESVFHGGSQIEDDRTGNQDAYVYIGDDCPEEIEKELKERISKASTNDLSTLRVGALERIIDKNKLLFRIRLGKGGPAKIAPMRVNLDRTKNSVKVNAHNDLREQRKFLDDYFEEFVKVSFFKVCSHAAWKATPHLAAKDLKANFGTTINMRLGNASAMTEK